ncbi:MAG: hypothetical protein P8Y70_17815 [Candidatus Lokiarchaeota archaeon]
MRNEVEKRLHRVKINLKSENVKCPKSFNCNKEKSYNRCNIFFQKCSEFKKFKKKGFRNWSVHVTVFRTSVTVGCSDPYTLTTLSLNFTFIVQKICFTTIFPDLFTSEGLI